MPAKTLQLERNCVTFEINSKIDIQKLQDLFENVGWNENKFMTKNRIRKMLNGTYAYVSAHSDNNLIGFARAVSDGVCVTQIFDVMVHTNYRRQKIAKNLMQLLLKFLDKKLRYLMIVDSSGIESFYDQFQFRKGNPSSNIVLYRDKEKISQKK